MPSITFDLETVTPLFLGGADPTKAELRPPAFRGALRYWFRAIAGINYLDNPHKLQQLESSIFGDTNSSSNIVLRLSQLPNNLELDTVNLNQSRNPGLSYLWFSTKGSGGRNPKPARQAIGVEEPVSFSLTLSTRPCPQNSEQQYKNLLTAINCFWFALYFGGFGSRERRGAGSLRVKKFYLKDINEAEIPKFILKFKQNDVPKYLKSTRQKVKKRLYELLDFKLTNFPQPLPSPKFELYSPATAAIYILKTPFPSWEGALENIGTRYQDYRRTLPRQDRAVFGLPLTRLDMNSRHPSPLRIKVIQSVRDYYCLLIKMESEFSPNSRINNPGNPNYKFINEFLRSFDNSERVG
ncbi:type III-B CRISPR module RAMP protein Cmr1 [Pleurocapsales cyanobacterium LEGE 06147]|nr:type III-B CRISPR module RAMP protein Cmr1 [Pleurocapsales cyanobacterium LEGE 06147]